MEGLPTMKVAIVFGTYNRLALLKDAIESVREAISRYPFRIIIVDGGSIDGSQEWLREQSDVDLIEQKGPLTGAVRAFNLGFGRAVDEGFEFVMHLNDDAKIITPSAIDIAIDLMIEQPKIGEVAFAYDLNGPWRCDRINGKPYANFGVIRREAGMAVAREQGDPTGRAWWNPIYRTYGADSEFGCFLHRLGWIVHPALNLKVHDINYQDDLRVLNGSHDPDRVDSKIFWDRWRNANLEPGPNGSGPDER
jgi:glycosyltransferase involved in cell wall biosynthesis